MELVKKDIIKSILLFLFGNALANLILYQVFFFFSIMFIYTSYANAFPHYINILAFLFFKIFLNYFVLRYSNFIDVAFKQKVLLLFSFLLDVCLFFIGHFYVFNGAGEWDFKIGLFVFSFFAGNLFSIFLFAFIRKLKDLNLSKMQKILFLILFKIVSLIVVFCFIFFLCCYMAFEGKVEEHGNYYFAALAFVSLVLYPLVIQNYILFKICKNIHLLKSISHKKILLITSVEFVIFYVLSLLYLFILYLKNNLY